MYFIKNKIKYDRELQIKVAQYLRPACNSFACLYFQIDAKNHFEEW